MKYFAISDLHLSLKAPFDEKNPSAAVLSKPMDVFGGHWGDYFERLTANWRAKVTDEDIVMISGDISWAMTLDEAKHDLSFIASMPGKKVLIRGNHDYWWSGISKIRASLPMNMFALQNDAIEFEDYVICGTRGWMLPENNAFKESEDRKIYDRELLRLTLALDEAKKYKKPIIVMMHYPPIDDPIASHDFVDVLDKYQVEYCVYGHIHGNKGSAFEGRYHEIEFINASVDRIDFQPLQILSV